MTDALNTQMFEATLKTIKSYFRFIAIYSEDAILLASRYLTPSSGESKYLTP